MTDHFFPFYYYFPLFFPVACLLTRWHIQDGGSKIWKINFKTKNKANIADPDLHQNPLSYISPLFVQVTLTLFLRSHQVYFA